jgi:Carboxypeptidase regulatory-like domain
MGTAMKTLLTAIVLCIFLAPAALSQTAASPQEKCAIAGTVIDAVSEQPLKGAAVRLRGMPGAGTPTTQAMSTVTDASGRFGFDGLAAGRYFLLTSNDGYVNDDHDNPRLRGKLQIVTPGQHINDVILLLLPGGVIAGHISNEAGKPLRGVIIEAMKSSYPHGQRELHDAAHATSNDAGEYRMAGLSPGKYFVRAKLPPALTTKPAGDKAYIPLFYPAASEQTRAVALNVRAGEELAGIDLNFIPVRTVHIRGRVIDARTSLPCKEAEVTLLGDQGETVFSPSQNFSVGGQAAFEFRGVPPGSYVLVAQPPSTAQQPKTMWGRTSVEIGDANVEHADIVVGPGADFSGHIRVEGQTAADVSKVDPSKLAGTLEAQEPTALAALMPDIDNATVKPDGAFVFREVPEGNYRINFVPVPGGFYLKSVGAGDVFETGINVSRGHAPIMLDIVVSPGTGRIDGTVMSDDKPFPRASVVLVPEGKRRAQPDYYRQAVTDQRGRFALRNIVPGDYTMLAWEHVERDAYMDPDFVARYEDRGKTVHVEDDGHIEAQDLDVIPDAETIP